MLSGAALAFTAAVGITADAAEATLPLANPIVDRSDGMLDQMARLRATTSDGPAYLASLLSRR